VRYGQRASPDWMAKTTSWDRVLPGTATVALTTRRDVTS
jgi:hypothetical protein